MENDPHVQMEKKVKEKKQKKTDWGEKGGNQEGIVLKQSPAL